MLLLCAAVFTEDLWICSACLNGGTLCRQVHVDGREVIKYLDYDTTQGSSQSPRFSGDTVFDGNSEGAALCTWPRLSGLPTSGEIAGSDWIELLLRRVLRRTAMHCSACSVSPSALS